jgi:hypothetical protein
MKMRRRGCWSTKKTSRRMIDQEGKEKDKDCASGGEGDDRIHAGQNRLSGKREKRETTAHSSKNKAKGRQDFARLGHDPPQKTWSARAPRLRKASPRQR